MILKNLPKFSRIIPIIEDNSRPAAFVPYVVQGYIFTNQYSTFELALLVTMQVRVVWAIYYHGSSIFRFLAIYWLFVQNIELRCCWIENIENKLGLSCAKLRCSCASQFSFDGLKRWKVRLMNPWTYWSLEVSKTIWTRWQI